MCLVLAVTSYSNQLWALFLGSPLELSQPIENCWQGAILKLGAHPCSRPGELDLAFTSYLRMLRVPGPWPGIRSRGV